MQNEEIKNYIENINNEFHELHGGSLVKLDSGEIFTRTEFEKYARKKIEKYASNNLQEIKKLSVKSLGIVPEQNLINKRSKKKSNFKTKSRYDGGDFNIVYRDKVKDVYELKLDKTEKLVYYTIRDFITYPQNCVLINGEIPLPKELEPVTGLEEKTIRLTLKLLEEKGLLKQVRVGRRHLIYVNPEYYASGKELDVETLRLFNIVQCDDEKVESYLES